MMAKAHLREVSQTTMHEIKKQSRRASDATRGVMKARAIEVGRDVAEKYRKGSSGAIMMLLDSVATQQIQKILPPKVTLAIESRPSLKMHDRLPEIVAMLDRVALNTDDPPCQELQQAVNRIELPQKSHENWGLFEGVRTAVAEEQGKCEYPLLMWLDVGEGKGKRFRVINDQHFFFVLLELANMMIH